MAKHSGNGPFLPPEHYGGFLPLGHPLRRAVHKNYRPDYDYEDSKEKVELSADNLTSFLTQLVKARTQGESNTLEQSLEDSGFLDSFLNAVQSRFEGLERDVFLVILNMILPKISQKLSKLCNIPLNRFKTPQEVLAFVTALIDTGVACQTARSIAFVLGNTNTGKTSLVNTLKDYIDHPSDEPRSVLTEVHSELLETQVMELYDSVSAVKDCKFTIHVDKSCQRPTLIRFRSKETVSPSDDPEEKPLRIKVVDMGGHHEYYCSSALFMAGNGLFLVCFDSSTIEVEKDHTKYYSSIGCYLDLIFQVAARLGIQPKIALVATKVDGPQNLKETFKTLLDMTKRHLNSRDAHSFLVDEVLETSSKHVTSEGMEEIHQKIRLLCRDNSLTEKPAEAMPESWFQLLELMKTSSSMPLAKIEELFSNIKKQHAGPQYDSRHRYLTEFKDILGLWIQNGGEVLHASQSNGDNRGTNRATVKPLLHNRANPPPDDSPETEHWNWCLICCALPFLLCRACDTSEERNVIVPLRETEIPPPKKDEEFSIVLNYFTSRGEILWFRDHPDLRKTVICQPMEFVKALRTVISHKFVQNFKGVQLEDRKSELLKTGLLSREDFQRFYKSTDQTFSEREVWNFLIELNLACSLADDYILVPCLINDKMERKMMLKAEELSKCPEAITVQYKFDHDSQSIGKYHQVLSLFIKNFVWGEEKGGNIIHAFSQKVEQRKLGVVGGVGGHLTWLKPGDVQDPDVFEFQITEIETSFQAFGGSDDEETKCHAVHRAIRLTLRPDKQAMSRGSFEIIKKFDEIVSEELGETVRRSLMCKGCQTQCGQDEDEGDFLMREGMELKNPRNPCTNFERSHTLDARIVTTVQQANPRKPFELHSLMSMKKETLGLECFKNSGIKTQLENGILSVGEQIWIYHDRSNNPCNPVTWCNPYSHVVVYVGQQDGVHQVVHVTKAGISLKGDTKCIFS